MADHDKQLAIVTLAAGIIAGRRNATVQEFQTALEDAKHLLMPKPAAAAYKEWQMKNGLTPTTPEEDAEKALRFKEAAQDLSDRFG